VDKLSASQRLDLNLEKGRMRDELQVLRDKSNEMEIKMDRETNALKAAVEQSKNEVLLLALSHNAGGASLGASSLQGPCHILDLALVHTKWVIVPKPASLEGPAEDQALVLAQVLRYSLSMILALMAAGLTAARLLGSK
jgi:hypothetical protein